MRMKYKWCVIIVMAVACLLGGCKGKNDNNVNINKGMELIKQNNYEEALKCFEGAILEKEDKQLLYRGEGIAYMGLKEYEKATECFLESFSHANGTVSELEFDTNYYLASAYYKLERYADAYDVYSSIIQLREDETQAYFLRACTLLKTGSLDAAIKDFEVNLKLQSENVKALTQIYKAMKNCGYDDEGKRLLQTYMDSNVNKLTDDEKGTLYYYLEDYENARIYLDSALNRGSVDVSIILGKTYEHLGDMNYASVIYRSYLEKNTPNPEVYNSLGTCLLQQKKYEEALEAFEDGLDMGESACVGQLRFNQIITLEYLGNFSKARELMVQYVVDYPDDNVAKREYEFLQTR